MISCIFERHTLIPKSPTVTLTCPIADSLIYFILMKNDAIMLAKKDATKNHSIPLLPAIIKDSFVPYKIRAPLKTPQKTYKMR